jgi:hypothetical protein
MRRYRRVSVHIRAIAAYRAFHTGHQDKDCPPFARNAPGARQTLASTWRPSRRTIVGRESKARPSRDSRQEFYQVAPVRRQNVHRCALAFLVLIADFDCKINDRNNDPDSAKHLPHRADHLPVHSRLLSKGRLLGSAPLAET